MLDELAQCIAIVPFIDCLHHLHVINARARSIKMYLDSTVVAIMHAHTTKVEVGNNSLVQVTMHERAQFNEWKYSTRRFNAEFVHFVQDILL